MLKNKLNIILKEKRKVSFSEYMEIILFDKEFGLYENHQILGECGHFITSPLISKHFSHCIAKHYLKTPVSNNIIEIGAGDGRLACDLLLYLKDKKKLPKKYFIIEKSQYLIKQQQAMLSDNAIGNSVDIVWISNFNDLPNNGFIISNELFDCIPTDIIKHVNKSYKKAYINSEYKIIWEEYDFVSDSASKYLNLPTDLPNNYLFEYSLAQSNIINEISKVVDKGYFLIFDYGYASSELYLNDRSSGTVACIKNHVADFNPLSDIGKKDISAFVNFTFIKNIFINNNWETDAFMNQGNYLLSFNILNDLNVADINEINAVKKLIMPNHMGELFKVLVMKRNISETDHNYFKKNDIIKL